MLKGLLIFATGVYSGIYLSQNYEVPPVDEPAVFFEKISQKLKELADESKKK